MLLNNTILSCNDNYIIIINNLIDALSFTITQLQSIDVIISY